MFIVDQFPQFGSLFSLVCVVLDKGSTWFPTSRLSHITCSSHTDPPWHHPECLERWMWAPVVGFIRRSQNPTPRNNSLTWHKKSYLNTNCGPWRKLDPPDDNSDDDSEAHGRECNPHCPILTMISSTKILYCWHTQTLSMLSSLSHAISDGDWGTALEGTFWEILRWCFRGAGSNNLTALKYYTSFTTWRKSGQPDFCMSEYAIWLITKRTNTIF